jgi:hypothetical protein
VEAEQNEPFQMFDPLGCVKQAGSFHAGEPFLARL